MINFSILIKKDGTLGGFGSWEARPEYMPLTYTFSREKQEDFLDEVNAILNEKSVMEESWGIRPYQPAGDIWIDKEKVTYDLTENDGTHYHLEIPTLEFKELLEKWNKFVEVNMLAFSTDNAI